MGHTVQHKKRKIDKRFLSKNKNLKLYKEKHSKIGSYKKEVDQLTQQYEQVDFTKVERFDHFPLTVRTKKGLRESEYVSPTDIQKETIGLALKGHDILGAAQTGSGKTLAFVIPLLERLYCAGWSILDGLGAIVITPTRELAYQIFEVLNKVGAHHRFSAALVIGGKDLAKERNLLDKCNIMICTPGRLLQHMDQNPLFNAENLKILVLDEADRILDLGFSTTMNAILENLPVERQTVLFSATQTKSVKDLARLSLKNPVYVSVHEFSKHTTPDTLQQSYIVCEAQDKMNLIWSFIKSHKKQKILVFMASCKQAKYTYESLCRLRPGVSLMALYGSLHQLRRMQIYDDFCKKNHAVMFATDVASRGLDFPNVNWVVQLDCPEDVNTYIHRAGRTARFEKGGESLLFLLPSEKESMVEQLKQRKVPIEEIKANPSKLLSIENKLDVLVGRDDVLNQSSQRAFKAYLKNIFLMKDKTVFDVTKIDLDLYANSLGIKMAPRIRFLEKHLKGMNEKSNTVSDGKATSDGKETKDEKITSVGKPKQAKKIFAGDNISDDEICEADFVFESLKLDQGSEKEEDISDVTKGKTSKKLLTKAAIAKRMLKKNIQLNTITKFDEDAKPIRLLNGKAVPIVAEELIKPMIEEGYKIESIKLAQDEEIKIDKELFSERVKSKHRGAKLKLKEKRLRNKPDNGPAVLNNTEEDEQDKDGSESENDSSGDDIDPNNMSNSESEDDDRVSSPDEQYSDEDGSPVESDDNSEEYHSTSQTGTKRKKLSQNVKVKKQKTLEDSSEITKSGRSIEDDEELALLFLNNT